MKAFYAVAMAFLLLLMASRPLFQDSYSHNPYFNGPVKKVQQRIYGINGHNVSSRYEPSGIPLCYCPPHMDNVELPTEALLLEAFDMYFDASGKRVVRKRYDGEGDDLELQVKTVWDSLGEYEQIKRKIGRDYSVSFDSVVRQYNPETHILRQYHWYRALDSAWRPLSLGTDSILQIGDYAVVHFDRYKILLTRSPNDLPDGTKRRVSAIQALDDSSKVDTILYQYKGDQIRRFSQFNAIDGYLVDYDEQDRKEVIIRTSYKADEESTIVRNLFNYDSLGSDYFIERIHNIKKNGAWIVEDIKTHYYFDRYGQLSRSDLINYQDLDTELLVYSNRFTYSADSSSIRREFWDGDTLLQRYDYYGFDQYGNPIGFEQRLLTPEGDTFTHKFARLVDLQYDAYGNWTQAIYSLGGEAYYKLERRFEYY
ncbi:MAG: hypothetical protein AAF927_14920 [Bacteroidota bacterium]